MGGVSLWWPIAGDIANSYNYWSLIYAVISIFVAAAMTPRVRGFAHRRLGGLGKTGTKEAEAASIAALIGGVDAGKALAEGAKRFRALPLSSLAESDLDSSTDSGLHRKTQTAALGDVDCFVSHSWSDAGAAKYARLHEWARGDDVRSDGEQYPLIWLDKACIDQSAIVENLQALPVFLGLPLALRPRRPHLSLAAVVRRRVIRVDSRRRRQGADQGRAHARRRDAVALRAVRRVAREVLQAQGPPAPLSRDRKRIRRRQQVHPRPDGRRAVAEAVRPEDLDNSDV